MTFRVIDENVLIVANDISRILRDVDPLCPEADDDCRAAALDFLENCAKARLKILVDDAGLVIEKYRSRMSGSGQPGSGDAIFRYIIENQYADSGVVRVTLTTADDGSFAEFPADEELTNFDRSDRIFVAISAAGPKPNRIVNCIDSDWSESSTALQRVGIQVEELCPQCIRRRPQ